MGQWEERQAQWYEQDMIYCETCGLILPKNLWIASVDGTRRVFCGADCERLFHEYLLPKQKESK